MKKHARTNYDLTVFPKVVREVHAAMQAGEIKKEIKISMGNPKLGKTANFNLLPVITCAKCARCTCAIDGCYAVKNCLAHGYNWHTNNCLRAWAINTVMVFYYPTIAENQLYMWLKVNGNKIDFFRIHASGDFVNMRYTDMWYRLIKEFQNVQFLAFTKQFLNVSKFDFEHFKNCSIRLSGWTNVIIPYELIVRAFKCSFCIGDGDAIPENALRCPGDCETCRVCWYNEIDTYFEKH